MSENKGQPKNWRTEINTVIKRAVSSRPAIILTLGFMAGAICGFAGALGTIRSHQYLAQKMYRMALYSSARALNRGIVGGILAAAALVALWAVLNFLKKRIGALIEIKIRLKRPVFGFFPRLKLPLLLKAAGLWRKRGWFKAAMVLFGAAVLINAASLGQELVLPPSGPNVLIVVADSLRADHLGWNGYDRKTSPNIDAFAGESVSFDLTFSNSPWTKTSTGTLLTSLYPHQHNAFSWPDELPDERLTLAEIFRNRSYLTHAEQANIIITRKYNFHQGFQIYRRALNEPAEKITARFGTWLKNKGKRPFFAYLHFMDTHYPFRIPADFERAYSGEDESLLDLEKLMSRDLRILTEMGMPESDKRHVINLYDDSIRYFDACFGRLMDNLRASGMLDKTIVVLVSDHGEELWDHGTFGHGHTLYQDVLHVPLMIRYPALLAPARVGFPVHLLDVAPTVLRLAGFKSEAAFSGENLLSYVLNERIPSRPVFFEGLLRGGEKKGIYAEGWKLIQNTNVRYNKTFFEPLGKLSFYKYPVIDREFELYWMKEDPEERTPLEWDQMQSAVDQARSEVDQARSGLSQVRSKLDLRGLLLNFSIAGSMLKEQKPKDLEKKLEDFKSLGYIK